MLKYYRSFNRYSKLLSKLLSKTIYPSKMTIISNHRVHSYKASASVRTRDISPKKINIQIYMPLNKHHTKQIAMPHRKHCTKQIAIPKIDDEIKPSYIPSTLLKTMANYTNGVKYKVIMSIEGEDDVIEDSADDCIDDDMEKAWAHYDYLEWLYD